METINGLLRDLNNKVPASIAKRLDGLKKLNEKLVVAKTEHNENPTEDSKESLDEIIDFINDTEQDLIDDLEAIIQQKRESYFKSQEEAKIREQNQLKQKREQEEAIKKRESLELKEKDLNEDKLKEKPLQSGGQLESEKKSEIGWGSLLLGGALLVLTGGAIKYFGNNR